MIWRTYEFHTEGVDYGRYGGDFVLTSFVDMEFKKEKTPQTLQDATHDQIDARFLRERRSDGLRIAAVRPGPGTGQGPGTPARGGGARSASGRGQRI